MTNLERIENYYTKTLSEAERRAFEAELKSNPVLVEEVAFYVQAQQAAQAEARARRLAELGQLGQQTTRVRTRTFAYAWAAAASVLLLIGMGWWLFFKSPIPNTQYALLNKEWAAAYIEKNFSTLNTQMSGDADSLQLGVSAYNTGDLTKAQALFDQLIRRDSLDAEAEKLSGIVSLRRGDYDQAIKHFHRLSTRPDLVSNPGKFYEALALLKRDQPQDKKTAENLLKEVQENKLEGWKEVE